MIPAVLPLACALLATAEYQNFQDPLRVTPAEERAQTLHDFARGPDGSFYLAYNASVGAGGIYIRRSGDEGASWSEAMQVFGRAYVDQSISGGRLTVDSADPKTLWCVFDCSMEGIVSTRSEDAGETWSEIEIITPEFDALWPTLAQNPLDGTLVVVYSNTHGWGVDEQLISRSSDGGESWSVPESLPKIQPNRDTFLCDMSIDAQGTLRVIYVSVDNPYLIQSSDNGLTWSSPSKIGASEGENGIGGCRLLVADGSIHVVYARRKATKYVYSDDNGLTWTSPIVVDRFKSYQYVEDLSIAALPDSTGMVIGYLCNLERYGSFDDIYYKVLRPGIVEPRRRLSNNIDDATQFGEFVAHDDGSLTAVYSDGAWSSQYFTDVVLARSIPDDPLDFGVAIEEETALRTVDAGSAYTLSFDVGNWTEASGAISTFVTAEDRDTGALYLLDQQGPVALGPNQQERLHATLRVPDWIDEGSWNLRVSVGPEFGVGYDSDGFQTGVFSD